MHQYKLFVIINREFPHKIKEEEVAAVGRSRLALYACYALNFYKFKLKKIRNFMQGYLN